MSEFEKLVEKNKSSHFFLDEVLFSKEEITPKFLAKISGQLSQQSYFWVASRSDIPPYKEHDHLKGTKYITARTICTAITANTLIICKHRIGIVSAWGTFKILVSVVTSRVELLPIIYQFTGKLFLPFFW